MESEFLRKDLRGKKRGEKAEWVGWEGVPTAHATAPFLRGSGTRDTIPKAPNPKP